MNLNKAMIIGNVTRDPEVRQTSSGASVATFSVATNFVWNDPSGSKQERVEFHNIVAWRKLAEICGQYLHKGSKVYVEGRLQTRDWVGKDGVKRFSTEIIAENLIMLDKAGTNGGQRPAYQAAGNGAANEQYSQKAPDSEPVINYDEPMGGFDASADDEIKVENIPF
ncbi:MAG: single-stranded DNA-binding protein [Candidatus Falkowbacteria bacterium]|nr:single-stranded DNA-binding protein [Candidatus Falkowbacteria bacterium]